MRVTATKRHCSFKQHLSITIGSLLLAFIIGGIMLFIAGINPFLAYRVMFSEAFSNLYSVTEVTVKATPLIITSLALCIAFRMKLWNIGGEGQIAVGAIAASYIALFSGFENSLILIPLMFVSAALAGGVWGGVAGLIKAKLNVSEVITTLMLNYVALSLLDYFVYGSWRDPAGFNFPNTAYFANTATLSSFFGTRMHSGFIIAIVLVAVTYVYLDKTVYGYEINVIGDNPRAAEYCGMHPVKKIMLIMFLSGAIAGVAGFCEVAGLQKRLLSGLTMGYGYTAIIIAWLSRKNPVMIFFVGLAVGAFFVGGDGLRLTYNISENFINAYLGLILFSLLIGDFFTNYKLTVRRKY